jgi:outer membrane protein assembly factor BamB
MRLRGILPRRRLWRAALPVAVVLVGLGVAALVIVLDKPGNVSHPGVQFTAPTTSATTTPAPRPRRARAFLWPWYGDTATRTRDFLAPGDLRPPLHHGWSFHGTSLLEFPPSIDADAMYVLDDGGTARRLDTRTGKVVWTRHVGTLAAATPAIAVHAGVVLMPVLSDTGHSPGDGRFVALSMKTGRVVWSHALAAGSESSPLVSGHSVYFGDGGGRLYALNVQTGHVEWTYRARGAIKGGPALWHGDLFFGDYAGRAYAVRAADGKQVWAVSTEGAHFGLGSGQFYATPAVAYGRVYMGNTDGRMYSFGARNGALAWATATGGYVYSSAAIADPRAVGPTVYAGSYDGSLYAFNARSGAVRWRHPAGAKISGSAVVIGGIVYFSTLVTHRTIGLDVATGAQRFSFGDGAFTPAVADEHAIYLVGYDSIYQMLPGAAAGRGRSRRRHR